MNIIFLFLFLSLSLSKKNNLLSFLIFFSFQLVLIIQILILRNDQVLYSFLHDTTTNTMKMLFVLFSFFKNIILQCSALYSLCTYIFFIMILNRHNYFIERIYIVSFSKTQETVVCILFFHCVIISKTIFLIYDLICSFFILHYKIFFNNKNFFNSFYYLRINYFIYFIIYNVCFFLKKKINTY